MIKDEMAITVVRLYNFLGIFDFIPNYDLFIGIQTLAKGLNLPTIKYIYI